MQINFLGEDGQDGGGPSWEFFRLLADDISCSMCIGRNVYYVLRLDTTGLQVHVSLTYLQSNIFCIIRALYVLYYSLISLRRLDN